MCLYLDVNLCIVICALLPLCSGNPHAMFKHFETLRPEQFYLREKRSAEGINPVSIIASFWAFQRRFSMSLTPGSRVLRPDAIAQLVDNKGKVTPFNIHSSKFYTGTLDGDPSYQVDASETSGVWIAHIHTPHEFYAVEPLRFYDIRANDRDMIVYRGQDLRADNDTAEKPFCKEILFEENSHNAERIQSNFISSSNLGEAAVSSERNNGPPKVSDIESQRGQNFRFQHKRSTEREDGYGEGATECDVLALAHYTVFKGLHIQTPAQMIQILVQIYSLVDHIFRESVFGEGFGPGLGIVLKGFIIHTEPTTGVAGHYNSENNTMDPGDILKAMTLQKGFSKYCLAHMTIMRFMGPTLGVAAVASNEPVWVNGICAGVANKLSRNVAMTTIIDASKSVLSMKKYSLVVAHEIGHNWGACHDPTEAALARQGSCERRVFGRGPKRTDCNPSSKMGGKFLMWPFLGPGRGQNSNRFSPCSKELILPILQSRSHKCFLAKDFSNGFCGDGIVDEAEDCDPGVVANTDGDRCCEENCRLRRGAVCSFYNSPCCTESCQIASTNQTCSGTGEIQPCFAPSQCAGERAEFCPPPKPAANGAPCGDQGSCWYGRCQSFCERMGLHKVPPRNLKTCQCESNTTVMCLQCCMDVSEIDRICKVMGGPVKDGTPCLVGHCRYGQCINTIPAELNLQKLSAENAASSEQTSMSMPVALLCLFALLLA